MFDKLRIKTVYLKNAVYLFAMIRMIQSTSASHAKSYFSQALQKADYYIGDQELQGQFHGRLKARLGLGDIATKEAFFSLCENKTITGEALTPRTKEDRTVGYDINFHCPKSVSLVHVLSKDNHILDAFQKSVHQTMLEIEADSMARVRTGGRHEDRKTGELVWAEFTHQTARPVENFTPDMHLHSHCFNFNATWDETEQKVKACQFRDINRDMPYYQSRFHKILADKLIDLGYQIRRTDKSFEIEGVPQGVIDLFSKRTDEIGRVAKEQGITDAKELSELGARTRSKKDTGLSMAELKADWQRQIQDYSALVDSDQGGVIRYAPKKEPQQIVAKDCVSHALTHSFERASVMAERRILASAYRQSLGIRTIELADITSEFEADKSIIHVTEKYRTLCTTREVLKEEQRMVDLARQGLGRFRPLYDDLPKIKLEGQQKEAIAHVLTSKDQVSIIRGVAGAGKTTLLTELDEHLKRIGKTPVVVAPSANASRNVLVEEGFKDAETTARLIIDENMKAQLQDNVLIVDEAGLLGTKDTTMLLELAKEKNARLFFVGDTRQHSSVTRGDALRILNTVGGINAAEISKIYRQKNAVHRSAVEDLSKGDVKEAFKKLDDIGSIKTIDPLKPNDELVQDYLETVKKGKSVLIVSPTHKQGNAVTAEIREKLKSSGMIGKKELMATKLINANLTEAEKLDWRNYQKGQVIQFDQNVPQFKRGTAWHVLEATEKTVILAGSDGIAKSLPLDRQNSFSVYQSTEIGLSKGDKVRITKNGFDDQDKRLNNGTSLEVASVSKSGKAILINPISKAKYSLDKGFGHIDHDYCVTSHTSQGKTVDEVFISQPASTFSATNAKQFYVSVSRAKDMAKIYTDDRDALLDNASEIGDRISALELVGRFDKHVEHVQRMEREYKKPDHNINREVNNRFEQRHGYEPEI